MGLRSLRLNGSGVHDQSLMLVLEKRILRLILAEKTNPLSIDFRTDVGLTAFASTYQGGLYGCTRYCRR